MTRPTPLPAAALPAAAARIPGRMGDHLVFTPLITRIGGASYATTPHAHRRETELVRFRFVNATTDLDTARPKLIPEDLRAALARYAVGCESLAP